MFGKKWIKIIVELVSTVHYMHIKIEQLERDLDTTISWLEFLLKKDQAFVEKLRNMPELEKSLLEGFFIKEEFNNDFIESDTGGKFIADPHLDNCVSYALRSPPYKTTQSGMSIGEPEQLEGYEEQINRFYEMLERF
jgi:hypothetical protein